MREEDGGHPPSSTQTVDQDSRRAELIASLGALRQRLARAADAAGRSPDEITLVAVTKTYPATDAATLAQLGVLDLGESRDQEARAKAAEVRSAGRADVRWHMVGRLQTNKARSVASYAHAVHSVDRLKLVQALADASAAREQPLEVFVQVSLDDDPARGGAARGAVDELTDAVAASPALRLCGLMAVPPLGTDPEVAFAELADLAARLRTQHPDAVALSAGMSDDLEAAVKFGATHVRVGSALLGRRGP